MFLCCLPRKGPRVEDEKRNKFSSIPVHLQIRIAEKIDYFEQMMFESSSKYGRNLLKLTQHKAVVKINLIVVNDNDTKFSCFSRTPKHPNGKYIELEWSMLRFVSSLPRFTVSQLLINTDSLQSLLEIHEHAGFTNNNLSLSCYYRSLTVSMFSQISKIFSIAKLCSKQFLDPDLFSEPKFQAIGSFEIRLEQISDEDLLQLRSSKIKFDASNHSYNRIFHVANLYFQDWFEKRRDIEHFEMKGKIFKIRTAYNSLFHGFPILHMGECDGDGKEVKISNTGQHRQYTLCGKDSVFSIDRGDRKLLIVVLMKESRIVAHDYFDSDDVIISKKPNDQTVDRRFLQFKYLVE